MKGLHIVAFILLVVGGLNWLLVGLIDLNLVQWLLGGLGDFGPRLVYILVGLAAIYELVAHKGNCMACKSSKDGAPSTPPPAPVV